MVTISQARKLRVVRLGEPAQRPQPINIRAQFKWHSDTRTHYARIRCTHKIKLGKAEENRH